MGINVIYESLNTNPYDFNSETSSWIDGVQLILSGRVVFSYIRIEHGIIYFSVSWTWFSEQNKNVL